MEGRVVVSQPDEIPVNISSSNNSAESWVCFSGDPYETDPGISRDLLWFSNNGWSGNSLKQVSESYLTDSAQDLCGSNFKSLYNAVDNKLSPYEGYLFDCNDAKPTSLPNNIQPRTMVTPTPTTSGPMVHPALQQPSRSSPNNLQQQSPQFRGSRQDPKRQNQGQGYRKLWQQVTKVSRGQKLSDSFGVPYSDMTVEDLLKIIVNLGPQESAIAAVAQGLHYLDSSALAALLKELSKQGHIKRAVEIFDWLRNLGDSHELSRLCDVYTYTTMISQCGSHHQLRRALELVAEMRSKGISCNVHTYSALMNVCIKANELELALDVYRQMLQEGCQPNLVTYNTLIDVYLKTGQLDEAIKVLDALQRQGIQPEVRTYNTIITAYNKAGQPEQALKIYQQMVAAGIKPSATTYTALISAYGKKGQVDKAVELFEDMSNKGCERNVITYSSLISACERAGRTELALQLFYRMHQENCRPNVVTYNSLIAACANGGLWEKANQLLEQMVSQGCKPDSITFSALIAAFEKGGQWRHALKAFEQMQQQGCHPDATVFNALLEVLWRSGIVTAQMRAAQLWSSANRSGHFRIYMHKHDTQVLQYSCIAFTTGAAIVIVLRWMTELRNKVCKEGVAFLKQAVRFSVQRTKSNRVEQPPAAIAAALTSLLAARKAPFTVSLQDNNIAIEAAAQDLAQWMHTPDFSLLTSVIQSSGSMRRVSAEALFVEDMALEARCHEAFAAVTAFEASHAAAICASASQLLLYPRTQMVQLVLKYQGTFQFQEDTAYDALHLMDRVIASGMPLGNNAWPLALCCCLLLAARSSEPSCVQPTVEGVAALTGFNSPSIIAMERNILVWLQQDTSAVSALRVAHLFLERLGLFLVDPKQSESLLQELRGRMSKLACNPSFLEFRPSVVAACLVASTRQAVGLPPFWPLALQAMTGYADVENGEFAACTAKLQSLSTQQ